MVINNINYLLLVYENILSKIFIKAWKVHDFEEFEIEIDKKEYIKFF